MLLETCALFGVVLIGMLVLGGIMRVAEAICCRPRRERRPSADTPPALRLARCIANLLL